jgi:hypothetical protein
VEDPERNPNTRLLFQREPPSKSYKKETRHSEDSVSTNCEDSVSTNIRGANRKEKRHSVGGPRKYKSHTSVISTSSNVRASSSALSLSSAHLGATGRERQPGTAPWAAACTACCLHSMLPAAPLLVLTISLQPSVQNAMRCSDTRPTRCRALPPQGARRDETLRNQQESGLK